MVLGRTELLDELEIEHRWSTHSPAAQENLLTHSCLQGDTSTTSAAAPTSASHAFDDFASVSILVCSAAAKIGDARPMAMLKELPFDIHLFQGGAASTWLAGSAYAREVARSRRCGCLGFGGCSLEEAGCTGCDSFCESTRFCHDDLRWDHSRTVGQHLHSTEKSST